MNSDDDNFWTTMTAIIAIPLLGPALLASTLPAVQRWLIENHVLVTEGVLIPVGVGAGLDLARAAICAGAVSLLILVLVLAIRSRIRAAQEKRRRA